MTPMESLQQHSQICDDLYALALEENRFLQEHRRVPDLPLLERKRSLLSRLDEALGALRAAPRGDGREPAFRTALDKARSRILQILQIDRENEQLLLRSSLSKGPISESPLAPPGMLQRIYSRHGA